MKRLKNELNALVNRGVDRHLRLAVTGLSRSGKTAFITAMVNQLLNIHAGARLPLLSAVREERLLGVKRIPQRDFGIPRFTYDEGLAQMSVDRINMGILTFNFANHHHRNIIFIELGKK